MSHPDPDEFTPTMAITEMLGEAKSKAEHQSVTRIGARLGWMWTCPVCLEANYLHRETCHDCGTRRLLGGAPDTTEG
ncbi:hypothetical protein ACFY0G_02060 [Streptomyces sp. NPDC001552]|uniref:hypothetical protein n=1 Tax=Streptomyces sp. NPDC001552 TaxID=3364587 RepID=UPI0036B7A895